MVSEFDFIRNLKSKYQLQKVGDDCAVLPKDASTDMLVTADMLVEDVDFRLEWTTPEFLGHKSLAVSISDIAAMGGKPVWAMLALAVPEKLWKSDFLDRFYQGWFALAHEHGVELIGGDISRTDGQLVIDSTVGGEVAKNKAIRRSGATAGQAIFVTSTLGGAAGGLRLLERGFVVDEDFPDLADKVLLRQLKPVPQLTIANSLTQLDIVTAMIDVSDGLSSDLAHLCDASRTGARIYMDQLPVEPEIGSYFHSDDCREMALDGGEDFELLFTTDEKNISLLNSLPVTRIGEMTEDVGTIELIHDGEARILEPKGYRHFG